MKKFVILISFMFFVLSLHSLGKLRVESIKELPSTYINIEVRDADGKYAPVLIVKTELKGLGFKNKGRLTKHPPEYDDRRHEYKFYLNVNQRVIEITHTDYEPLEVRLLADYGLEATSQRWYEMVLSNEPEKVYIWVNIITDPSDALKIIDGENLGTAQSFQLSIGKHTLKVQKDGFKTKTLPIEVSESKTLFKDIELEEIEPVMVTIKSNPTEATIYLEDVEHGKTNKQVFRYPGNYRLRLVKSKYETIEETITVTETGSNIFSYPLEKSTVMLTISTTPSDTDIYLNNEKLAGNTKEVSPGKYRIEVSKTGYFSESRPIEVKKGKDKTEYISLKQQKGILQFTIEPMEAKVFLFKDGVLIQTWEGSKYINDLPVDQYKIEATKTGYKNESSNFTIEMNKTSLINFTLEKKLPTDLSFTVHDLKEQPMDIELQRTPVQDVNNEWAALIKISTDLIPFTFQTNTGVVQTEKKIGEFWAYIPAGASQLIFSKEGFSKLRYTVPITIKSNTVYTMLLSKKADWIHESDEGGDYESDNKYISRELKPESGTTSKFAIYEEAPIAIRQIRPVYPEFARHSGIEGRVILEVEVFEDGSVGAINVLKSLMSGPGGLDKAAIKAVRQWEFQPAKSGGKPVAVWITLPVTFSLD